MYKERGRGGRNGTKRQIVKVAQMVVKGGCNHGTVAASVQLPLFHVASSVSTTGIAVVALAASATATAFGLYGSFSIDRHRCGSIDGDHLCGSIRIDNHVCGSISIYNAAVVANAATDMIVDAATDMTVPLMLPKTSL